MTLPKAGLFAPREEKAFVKGVTAYMHGDFRKSLAFMQESEARDTGERHIAEEYFAGFCHVALDELGDAIQAFETVVASAVQVPDHLMQKYGVGGGAEIQITGQVIAELPHSNLAAALMLAELYQRTDRSEQAIELLESLGAVSQHPLFALSLADLYAESERWNDVQRVTEEFISNEDDATSQVLLLRAASLHEAGLNDAALEVLKEALKSKKRDEMILKQGRYLRGRVYEAMGKRGRARQEFERLYAVDPEFADIRARIHR